MVGIDETDIFDKLMSLPGLRIFQPLFRAHREILLYLFFGGTTFVLNVASYALFQIVLSIDALVANIMSWVLSVGYAFFTNWTWVFRARQKKDGNPARQLTAFYAGRFVTLLVEEAILAVFIVRLGFPSVPVKIAAQAVVSLLNYLYSKLLVFRKRR